MESALKEVAAADEHCAKMRYYIQLYLPELSERELRLVLAFIRGIRKAATV